jgi:hypothetical protein
MKPAEFWDLEFYEWSLWILRIKTVHDRRRQDSELLIELERNTMALHAQLHGNKHLTGKAFYTLPYDDKNATDRKMTGEEMFEMLKEQFNNKPLRKKGNG